MTSKRRKCGAIILIDIAVLFYIIGFSFHISKMFASVDALLKNEKIRSTYNFQGIMYKRF